MALALLTTVLALTCVSAGPTATPTTTATPTAAPTPTPTPIPTQLPGRTDLYETVFPPEHMAYVWWYWDNSGAEFRELEVEFTIHNDPGDFSNRHGLYLMVCFGDISGTEFYFGLQTDTYNPGRGRGRGKGLIFSRWGERDLSFTKVAGKEDGWSQSSGH